MMKTKKITQKENIHIYIMLVVYVLILLFGSFVVLTKAQAAYASAITVGNVDYLINRERILRGIPPLKENSMLVNAAYNKSRDMIENNYFEHYALGKTPWMFIDDEGYDYIYAGENLAMDFDTAEGMVAAWMSSDKHRKNILNPDFKDNGIGIVKGEFSDKQGSHQTTMVTNMFGREKPKIVQVFDVIVNSIRKLF